MKAVANTLKWTFRSVYKAILLVSISFAFFSLQTFASPASLTYQGRILKSDGTPLEYSNVSFIFQITDPAGTCVIYQEQINGYNMNNSGGVFDVPIGQGTILYPLGGTATVLDVFNNSGTFNCGSCSFTNGSYSCSNGSGRTYNATSGDVRKLRVSFYDGVGWKLITPDNTIRSVPFAGYALAAEKLGTNVASDFLLKAGLPTCAAGTFLSYNGTSLSCAPVAGASGGTVTNVTSSNPYLTVINNTSTPTLTVNIGTTANTVAAGDDPRFSDARIPTGAAGGVLNGTYPNPGLADNSIINSKISDGAISTSKLFANPGVNRLVATDGTTGSSLSALTCSNGQLLTWNIASGWQCSNQNSLAVGSATIAGSATNFSGSLAGDVSGSQGATSVDKIKGVPLDFSVAPANGQVLKFNGTNWAPGTDNSASGTVTNVSSANGDIGVVNATSTPVLTLNSGTNANQIVKLDALAKLPSVDGSQLTNFQVSQIPNLSAAKITSGILAVAQGGTGQYTYTDGDLLIGNTVTGGLSKATLTAGTGVTITNGNGSISISATGSGGTVTNVSSSNSYLTVNNNTSTPTLTVNVGTIANTVAAGNDPRFSDARTPTGAAGGVLNGTYPNPGLVDNSITNTKISDGAVSTSKLFVNPGVNRLVATDSTTGASLTALTCSSGQLLTWNVASGWQCSNQSSLSVGSATTASSATNFTGSLAGDVSGTQGATSVDKIKGIALDFSTTPASGQVLKFNGTNWAPANDSNAGGTVTSVTGTAPISVATGTSTPVVSISQATTSTNGYLSSADWNTFNGKQSALGFTPLNPSNNLSDVGNVATSRTNLGLGTSAVKNVPAVGNAAATEVVLGNDSRLSDSRTPTGSAGGDLTGTYPNPTLATTGVTAGTYPKVTVDVKGRVTAGANLLATDIPNLDWSKITTGKPTTLSGYGITDSLVVNGGNAGSISSGLDNAKPISPATGDLFVATDVKRIYRYSGISWDQLADASSAGAVTALTGDVTAVGPGSVAATVNTVGGKTSAAISTSVNDTLAATNINTNSTIVKRDASGNFAASNATLSSVMMKDGQATPNTVTLQVPATVTANYVLKFPAAQGSANQLMVNDGSGNLIWTNLPSATGVTSVTAAGTAGNPISIGGTATAPTVDIAKATSSTNGYLSSADWTTFNNKQSASLADAKIWVGQTGTPTAVTPSGDISMTNAGAFTVTGIRGKTVSSTAPSSAGQVLRYDGTSSYIPAFLGLADIRSTITPFGGAFANAACTAGQTLYWQSSTDTFQCQSIAVNDSQLSFTTSRTANTFLAAPNGSAGAATFRTIASADLPAGTLSGSGTAGYVPYYSTATTLANSSMFVSGGNVGIGTTSPSQIFHVSKDQNAGTQLLVSNTNGGSAVQAISSYDVGGGNSGTIGMTGTGFTTYGSINASNMVMYSPKDVVVMSEAGNIKFASGSNTEKMRISSNGNVGIGTTGPTHKLEVNGNEKISGNSNYTLAISTSYDLALETSATNRKVYFAGNGGGYSIQSTELSTGNNIHLTLNPNGGNVGIGTTNPGQKLDVVGNINVSGSATVGGSSVWTAGNLTNLSQLTNGPGYLTPGFASTSGQPASTALANEGGYGAFQAQSQGSGGSAGAAFMSFHRPGAFAAYFGLDTDNQFKIGGWSMGATSYAIIHSGNIGSQSVNYANSANYANSTNYANSAGTLTAGATITSPNVSGNINVSGAVIAGAGNYYSGQRSNFYLSLQPDRNLVLYDNGGAVWTSGTQVSDIRLKENIRPLEDVLPIVMQLDVIRFSYLKSIDELQTPQIGVIAQEINKYFPELVYHDKKTDRYMVYYDKLTSLLIKAMQELRAEKDRQFNDLKSENAELRSAVCEINPKSKICNQQKVKKD